MTKFRDAEVYLTLEQEAEARLHKRRCCVTFQGRYDDKSNRVCGLVANLVSGQRFAGEEGNEENWCYLRCASHGPVPFGATEPGEITSNRIIEHSAITIDEAHNIPGDTFSKLMKGGLKRGNLTMILAPTGRWKSWFGK